MPVEHYENFPVASLLLPRAVRRPIEHIYAFARSADDIADEGDLAPAERISALDAYLACLDRIEAGSAPTNAFWPGLAAAISAYRLPLSLFRDLIDAFKQDITTTRYRNFDELHDYCTRSANPIGRLLLHLMREDSPQNLAQSDKICTALQLINHWQDIAIDWKKNGVGRVYVPEQDLVQFGLEAEDIASAPDTPSWQALMMFQTTRARNLMYEGAPLAHRIKGRFGAELRLIVAGGLAVLDKIDAVDGDVFRHRPQLTKLDWCRLALPAVFGWHRVVAAPCHGAGGAR
jgi:phytoene synthase